MTFEIEGFTPLGVLGQGGFGTVHRAADDAHGREVAVKVLGRITDDSARRRFDRERRAMGTLSGHPTIGVVYTSGFTANEEPYIVMEMIRGGSLADRLEKGGPLPASEVVELGATLAEALHHAHEGGVLHLDLKPENILMSRFGMPKIVDFGIAAIVDDESATSTIRATPAYADPQILNGSPGTEQSDVYGLAATLFTLLDGAAPYSHGPAGLYRVMQRVALDPVPKVERADVSSELSELLHRSMAKDPSERPGSMDEFERLLRAVESEPATQRRPSPRRVDRSKQTPASVESPKAAPLDEWPGQGERPRLPGAVDASNPVRRSDPAPTPTPPITPVPPARRPAERRPDQPVAPQPVAQHPVVAQPVAAQPVAAQPVAAQPVASQALTPSGAAPQGASVGVHSATASGDWPLRGTVQPSASRQRTNTTAVAVLATLAVILAAVLAFVVVRRSGQTEQPPVDSIEVAETAVPVTTGVDVDTRVTDDGTLPDLTGLRTDDARDVARASDFDVAIPLHCFDTVESQVPSAGTAAEEGAAVTLRFPPCVVPDFVGLRLPEARRIVDEEFVVGLLITWSAHCDDVVLSQNVVAGVIVEPSTVVELELEQDCSG